MSIWTIILIILVIALLGGFSELAVALFTVLATMVAAALAS